MYRYNAYGFTTFLLNLIKVTKRLEDEGKKRENFFAKGYFGDFTNNIYILKSFIKRTDAWFR